MKKTITIIATLFTLLLCCTFLKAFSQTRTVSGKITSEDGEALAGVNILVKGSPALATTTDQEGYYKLNVSQEFSTLTFSFVGYTSKDEIIGNRTVINVILSAGVTDLSNVVVVGYGTQRRKDLTGAVASISSKELSKASVASFDQALQGRVAGVLITNDGGDPGGGVSVKIRGVGTVNNTEPLYVIDGVPITNNANSEKPSTAGSGKTSNPLANINPNDIASIDILKDASASAIYGVRGANGVVIITTKRGKQGKAQLSFDSYAGIQNVHEVPFLKARDYADLIIEMFKNANEPLDAENEPINLLDPSYVVDRADWQKAFFKTAVVQNYYMDISGGTDKVDYSISGGVNENTGTSVGMGFKRYSLRINSNYRLGKVNIGESVSLSRTRNRRQTFTAARSPIRILAEQAPTVPVFNSDNLGGFGGPISGDGYSRWNPVGLAELTEHYVYRNRLIGSLFADWEIFKGLKYKINLGMDLSTTKGSDFLHSYYFSPGMGRLYPSLTEYNSDEISPLIENTLTYSKSKAGHDLTLLAGYTQQSYTFKRVSAFASALQSDDKRTLNTARADAQISITGLEDIWAIRSFLGRLNYGYNDKYLFTANIRRDGSSRFGPGHKWGTFPSFSLGWKVNNEGFMKNVNFINELKLRGGYGVIGNQEVPPYGYEASLITTANYPFGSGLQGGVTPISLANPDLKWEVTSQTNLGLDLSLLKGTIQFTADYFIKKTKDMVLNAPLPGSLGVDDSNAPVINAGDVINRGTELSLTYMKNESAFKYDISANAAFLYNKVTSLGVGTPFEGRFPDSDGPVLSTTKVGYPIGSFIGHLTDGIFQTQQEVDDHAVQPGAQPGDIRFKDVNNDNVIDGNDRVILGNPIPKFSYGFSFNSEYKGFDFSFFFQGIQGLSIYNGLRYWTEGMAEIYNADLTVLNRWTGPGTSNTVPRAVLADPNFNRRPSDRFLENGAYLRLRNVSLGYTLPESVIGSIGKGFISKVRIYISGQNLWTLTKYTGFDPEIGTGYNQGVEVANQGVDYGIQPQPRVVTAGIRVSF